MRNVLIADMLLTALHASAGEYMRYVNSRFGVSCDYPTSFTRREPAPDNGDGQAFRTADGAAVLRIFGFYNVDSSSAGQLMQSRRQAGISYSYTKSTKTWFVLSGTKSATISYIRCNLGAEDVVGCFDLEYPVMASILWAPVVARLSKSLVVANGAN